MRRRSAREWACLYKLPVLFFVLLVASGCASSRMAGTAAGPGGIAEAGAVEPRLRSEIDRWQGTPHVLGGTSSSGMDCSAFVQRVFRDAFEVGLPRTTEAQASTGRPVRRSELQPGDLVFFRPPAETRHVGIYLSDGEFAHVSTTLGVTVSELDRAYWRSAYWTSRRVLEEADRDGSVDEGVPPAPASDPDGTRSIGW